MYKNKLNFWDFVAANRGEKFARWKIIKSLIKWDKNILLFLLFLLYLLYLPLLLHNIFKRRYYAPMVDGQLI